MCRRNGRIHHVADKGNTHKVSALTSHQQGGSEVRRRRSGQSGGAQRRAAQRARQTAQCDHTDDGAQRRPGEPLAAAALARPLRR